MTDTLFTGSPTTGDAALTTEEARGCPGADDGCREQTTTVQSSGRAAGAQLTGQSQHGASSDPASEQHPEGVSRAPSGPNLLHVFVPGIPSTQGSKSAVIVAGRARA